MITIAYRDPNGTYRLEADGVVVMTGFQKPSQALAWGEANGFVDNEVEPHEQGPILETFPEGARAYAKEAVE